MNALHQARVFVRRCLRPIRPPASARSVDQLIADIRKAIMNPSATAASILDQVNALPGAIAAQEAASVAASVAAAEAAATAAHQADLDSIAAALTTVAAGITPAAAPLAA
jgi:cell division septum initiation protein DivIVA